MADTIPPREGRSVIPSRVWVRQTLMMDVREILAFERLLPGGWGPKEFGEYRERDPALRGLTVADRISRRVLGAVMYSECPKTFFIWRVAVAPGARRHGLGRALVEGVKERAAWHGRETVQALIPDDNASAWGLFYAAGFCVVEGLSRPVGVVHVPDISGPARLMLFDRLAVG